MDRVRQDSSVRMIVVHRVGRATDVATTVPVTGRREQVVPRVVRHVVRHVGRVTDEVMTAVRIVRKEQVQAVPIVVVHHAGRATDVATIVQMTGRRGRVGPVNWAELPAPG